MHEIRTGNQCEIMAEFQEMKRKMDGDSLPHGVSEEHKDSYKRFTQSQQQVTNEHVNSLRKLNELKRFLLIEKIGRKIESAVNGLEIEKIKLKGRLDNLRKDKAEVEAKQSALSDGDRRRYEGVLGGLNTNIKRDTSKKEKLVSLIERLHKEFISNEDNIKRLIENYENYQKFLGPDLFREIRGIINRHDSLLKGKDEERPGVQRKLTQDDDYEVQSSTDCHPPKTNSWMV